jgi:hypothetical protein
MARWVGWIAVVASVACGPASDADSDSDSADSTAGESPADPRITRLDADYVFDSGCTPYRVTNVTIELHAVDAPIEQVELVSYAVAGYMSGMDVTAGAWGGGDALPLAIGETAELRFSDSEDGWAGECADFEPPSEGAPLEVVVSIDGEEIELAGTASIGCGWSEC